VKQRSFFLILFIGVCAVLSLAGGVLAWTLQTSPLNEVLESPQREPQASLFVPKHSPVMISLLVNPDSLENLTKWRVSPFKRSQTQRDIRQLETNLLNFTGLDYRKEVKPWLGDEISLAITSLDYDHNGENGTQPGYLLAVQTKKPELAKEFLQAAYSQNALRGNSEFTFEEYKGVNLISQRLITSQSNTALTSSAVLADFVLFANNPKILREAINTLQVATSLSLKSSPAYAKALETANEPRLGLVYGNLPLISAWLDNAARPENSEILQTLTVSLSLQSDGIVAQTALIDGNPSDSLDPILSEPVGALKYIPDDSIIALAGVNLPQLWTKIQTELAKNSPLQELLNDATRRLESNLGLSISQEVFPWVTGEFSLALINSPTGGDPEWLFVVERQPLENVVAGLNNLDTIATKQGLSVASLAVDRQQATVWSQLEPNQDLSNLKALVKGVHTTISNYEVLATSVEALNIAIKSSSRTAISPLEQAAIALPKNNDGYVYVNWKKFDPLLEQKYPIIKFAQLTIQPFLDYLNSVILTSLGRKNGVYQSAIYFNLSPLK